MSLDSYLQVNRWKDARTGVGGAEVARRLDHFRAVCRQARVRLTPQRLEIFREVAASLDHPDAETVYRGIRVRMPTVSLDTVYRTLSLLRDLGLITALGPRRESVRFDANLQAHHHYVCMRCGRTWDIEGADLNTRKIPSGVRELGSVVTAQIEVQGVCTACSERPSGRTRTKGGAKP